MYEHIIVGYDGSEGALDALTLAQALAPGGRMTLCARCRGRAVLSEVSIDLPRRPRKRESTWEALDRLAGSLGVEAGRREHRHEGLHEAAERLRRLDRRRLLSPRTGRPPSREVSPRTLLNGSPCAVAVAPHGYREQDRADSQDRRRP